MNHVGKGFFLTNMEPHNRRPEKFFSVLGPGLRPDLDLEAVAAASRRRPWTARLAP
jgi:hypothetical protein